MWVLGRIDGQYRNPTTRLLFWTFFISQGSQIYINDFKLIRNTRKNLIISFKNFLIKFGDFCENLETVNNLWNFQPKFTSRSYYFRNLKFQKLNAAKFPRIFSKFLKIEFCWNLKKIFNRPKFWNSRNL